jgi:hypothetical protein
MSENATLRAVDAYLSPLGGVTPSKLQGLERVASSTDQSYFSSDFTTFKTTLQQVWARDPFRFSREHSQLIKLPASVGSEDPGHAWQKSIWRLESRLPMIVHLVQQPSGTDTLQPSEEAWQTTTTPGTKSHAVLISFSQGDYRAHRLQHWAAGDLGLSMHEGIRPSNLFVVSQPREGKTEQSEDEKRYKELNQKYYNGTITKQEELELLDIQQALDEADARDPQLMALNKDVAAGYDRLHAGLHQINKVLDELLATQK